MEIEQIRQDVDAMIAAEDLPTSPGMRPLRQFDCLREDDPDEAEAWLDFIRWYLGKPFQTLEIIPKPDTSEWIKDLDEFGIDQSAMNTYDFDTLHPNRFNLYHWQLKKDCEKVKNMAIDFSIISEEKVKQRIRNSAFDFIRNKQIEQKEILFRVWLDFAYWK